MQNEFYLTELSAAEVAISFAQVAKDMASGQRLELNVSTNLGVLNLNVAGTGPEFLTNDTFKKFLEKVQHRPSIYCTAGNLSGPQNTGFALHYRERSQHVGLPCLIVERSSNEDVALKLTDAVTRHFKAASRPAVLGAQLPQAERDLIQYRESVVAKLESQVAMIASFSLEQVERQTEHFNKVMANLQTQYQAKQDELEKRAQEERDSLSAARKVFEEEKKQFDDRDRTHVRRALLDKLNTIIEQQKTNVGISPRTTRGRWAIHAVCAVTMLLGAVLAYFFAWKLIGSDKPDLRWSLPLASGTALFVSTLIYYLRWNDSWFNRLARAEFANRKMEADVTRASWVAELFFEYKDERASTLPATLLRSFTRDLFKEVSQSKGAQHPAEEFAQMLGQVQSVTVNKDGLEISRRRRKAG